MSEVISKPHGPKALYDLYFLISQLKPVYAARQASASKVHEIK